MWEKLTFIIFFSLPDVLIIHLKRFRQTNNASNKLSTLVEFPLEGCDMSPFVTKSGNSRNLIFKNEMTQRHNIFLKLNYFMNFILTSLMK